MLVAVTLAILVTASVPRFANTASRLRAEHTFSDFIQLMRHAQFRSAAQGMDIAWVWDAQDRLARLEIVEDDDRVELDDRYSQSKPVREEISITLEDPEERSIDEVVFFADGTADAATLIVATNAHKFTATIDASTGQVEVPERSTSF